MFANTSATAFARKKKLIAGKKNLKYQEFKTTGRKLTSHITLAWLSLSNVDLKVL